MSYYESKIFLFVSATLPLFASIALNYIF